MLLGEALIKANVMTEAQLEKAIKAKTSYPNLSLGGIIMKLFAIPRDVLESHYINHAIIPFIKEWLQKRMDEKMLSSGVTMGSTIAEIALTIPTFTSYEGEGIIFELGKDGMYQENKTHSKVERVLAIIDPLVITTTQGQEIIFNDIHIEVNLTNKMVSSENPGFLSEVKIRLLKANKGSL